ncbi:MAG: response regulator [Gammaproteobacteria bacterium]|nr:response regulator [Gammaproteobacteria bacterium]
MNESSVTHHIMVVDDEDNVLKALRRELKGSKSYNVHTFNAPEDALAHAAIHRFDLLITDYKMPWMHGLTFIKHITALQPHIAVIVISANADEALRHSHFNEVEIPVLLSKPWHRAELLECVASALDHQNDEKS